jgi:uncharacterized protein involved in outer membrane biogenesis
MPKIKLIIGIFLGVLLIAVAGFTALLFVNPSVFRSQLEAGATAAFGRQVQFGGPNGFDTKLNLHLKQITDSPLPVSDVTASISLTSGSLAALFHAKIAGGSIDGEIQLNQQENIPNISLKAAIKRLDTEQIFKRLNLTDLLSGPADTIDLIYNSQGQTLNRLFKQADLDLNLKMQI